MQFMGCSIFVFCVAAGLFTSLRHNMRIHEYTHLFTYVRSVPFLKTPRDPKQKTYEQRNHFSVYKQGAPDSLWIPQRLATVLQSVSKSYHSRLQRCFLDIEKMQTFQSTRLPRFAKEIQITVSVISMSFTLHMDLMHGDNCAQHEHEGASADRGCQHASTQQECVWSSVQKRMQMFAQSGRYNCSILINLKCVNNVT